MRKCIFCLKPTEGSVEHVIPMALGKRNLIINDVCPYCNNLLGAKVDKGITDNFVGKMLREQHNLAGHSGKVPHPLYEGIYKDESGEKYKINLDGRPTVVPHLIEGKNSLQIVAPSKEWALKMGETHLQRKGYSEETLERFRKEVKAAPIAENHPTLRRDFEIDLSAIECGFLKIAYEFAYQQIGEAYLNDPSAKMIRKHLWECMHDKVSNPKGLVRLMPAVFMECLERTPRGILHTLFLVSNSETVMVGVSMFHSPAYSFLMRMSDKPSQYTGKSGFPLSKFYYIDGPIVPYA